MSSVCCYFTKGVHFTCSVHCYYCKCTHYCIVYVQCTVQVHSLLNCERAVFTVGELNVALSIAVYYVRAEFHLV